MADWQINAEVGRAAGGWNSVEIFSVERNQLVNGQVSNH